MSISRDAVGVCLLGDRLYAVGGYDGQVYLNNVEAYDPQTNEWTQVKTSTHINTEAQTHTHAHAHSYHRHIAWAVCAISFILLWADLYSMYVLIYKLTL